MLGRPRRRPDRDDPALPSEPAVHDLGARPPDGPIAFEMTRIGGTRSGRRAGAAVGAFAVALTALVGIGVAGRPTALETASARVSGAPLASPAGAGPARSPGSAAAAGRSLVVLTSPSHDEALVTGHLAVVGFVTGEARAVELAIDDGERVVGTWLLATAAKAGDPAFQSRAWFETQLALETLPASRLLWVEVGIELDDGRVDAVRRSFRIGPLIEPDAD